MAALVVLVCVWVCVLRPCSPDEARISGYDTALSKSIVKNDFGQMAILAA